MGISVTLSRSIQPPPRPITMNKLALFLALAAFVATAYAQADCQTCVSDIVNDVDVCKGATGQAAIVTCVMEAVKTSADCITCACEVLTQVFKLNESMCK